jgi:hypothetical protein
MDDNKEDKRTREEQEIDNIDEYLAGIEPGYTVVIQRLDPQYARGILDEISVDETKSPINLKYLINTWGGHKLRLRFRRPNGQWAKHRDLNLYSFPPLVYGVPVPPETSPHMHQHQAQKTEGDPRPHYYPPPPPAQSSQKEMLELMALMQKMRSDDLNALGALWQAHRQESPPPPPQPQYDPIRMLQGAFGLFAQFQQLRAPQEAGENDEILGLLGKAVDVFANNSASRQDSRITPPSSSSSSSSVPTHVQLAQMEPLEAIATLRNAAAQMPPEKQAELMGGLLGSIEEIGGQDILLDQLEQRGIIPEYDDEDEQDSENDETSYSGGEQRSDGNDNSSDRQGD